MSQKSKPITITSSQGRHRTQRKLDTLEALADLYCARTKDIARYVRNRIPTVNDLRATLATLEILQHFDRKNLIIKKKIFGIGNVYGLSQSGVNFASDKMGIITAREFEIRDIEHELLITSFHIHLREFARRNNYEFTWEQEAIDHKKLINPDAIATLTTPKGTFYFCIEPERQKFNENFLKKAKKYFTVFRKPEAEELFGSKEFRVIFIVDTERKRQTVLQKFAEEYPYKMFWVTTVPLFQHDIAGQIFKTPKDYRTNSYSFLDI
jgi:hypothetical protein